MVSSSNKKFFPNGNISRVEALKMIINLFVWNIQNKYTGKYIDVKATDWFSKYVEYAVENNIFTQSWTKFFPNKDITRYEVIWILKKLSWN